MLRGSRQQAPWHSGSPSTLRPGPRRAFPLRPHKRQLLCIPVHRPGPWSVSLTPAGLPHPFLPGDLTGQLLDPVEKRVCCASVQRLWTKQGHTPAGRATPGPLPEGKENRVRGLGLGAGRGLGWGKMMLRKGKSEVAGASPAAGLLPVEVDWPAPEVEVIVGQLPLWTERGKGPES